ncbi:dihydroorotase [Acidiferrobacter sp.]|jgi:dihydroorotase|uniref:dihydroorotase n=1 Tax=Acidiferrobacter sp. TaxID=1872107 RepID=UPI00261BC41A|nr:dihydroorotase [Acidiferrobacter sp.]
MNIAIVGGRVIDPARGLDTTTSLFVQDGVIAGLGEAPAGFMPGRTIDAQGLVVCPGLIDLRARLREPGLEHKGTVETETHAALAGGITQLCCPPDTNPVMDTPVAAQWLIDRAQSLGGARVRPIGALTRALSGTHLADMHALHRAGCVGVGNALVPIKDTAVLRHALEYAAGLGLLVFLTPEDPWMSPVGVIHEGRMATRLGLAGIPESAETIEIARALMLIEEARVRAHFCGISSARGAALIAEAKNRGLAVTADTPIHQLYVTEDDIGIFDTNYRLRPPARTAADRDALRAALAAGVIDALCSDHQPHEADAKERPFSDAEPGIAGLETLLPLTLRLVELNTLTLKDALAAVTSRPAALLGIPEGTLGTGRRADICIYNPQATWTPTTASVRTRGCNSPFYGTLMRGQVMVTIQGGRIAYERSEPR